MLFRPIVLIIVVIFFSNAWSQDVTSRDSVTNTNSQRQANDAVIKDTLYSELDIYAKNTPEEYSRTVEQLAAYLGKKASNDLDKARLIFSWIATHISYDDRAFNTGIYGNEKANSVLKRRTAVCAGYSSLFEELANLMSLKVAKVSGYAKGYGYENGRKVFKVNHDWNAVKIDGKWRLIDVTWGSGQSERTRAGLKSTMKFDDYWFLVPPQEFIFSHLPLANKWQLNKSTINLKKFNDLPSINESLFKMGFDSKRIFDLVFSGKLQNVVKTFNCEYLPKVIDAPFTSPLIKGQEYTFSFKSNHIKRIAFAEKGRNWTYFKRENNVFSGVIRPKSENLSIAIATSPNFLDFTTIAEYKVIEK